jgi:cycloartenol synthase
VITLSITGALNAVLSDEHKKEMIRYLYNHQACFFLKKKNSSFIGI